MKILIDKLPIWSEDCLFSEDVWVDYKRGHKWHDYKCKLKNDYCDLYDGKPCPFLKEVNITDEN